MRLLASLFGALVVLALPSFASAKTCTAPGHPTCTIRCPGNQACAAGWIEPNGPCKTRCYPAQGPNTTGVSTGVTSYEKGGRKNERDMASGLPTGKRMHKPLVTDGAPSGPVGDGDKISPRDVATGQATGKRQYKPLTADVGVSAPASDHVQHKHLGGVKYEDKIAAGRRCRSEAFDKEDAEDFCRRQLNCAKGMICQGTARRWICWCK